MDFGPIRRSVPPCHGTNVIVYLLDTLRADHVGDYGSHNATIPTMDRLARQGALFLRRTAQAPWVRSSIASILTSLYPPEHDVIDQEERQWLEALSYVK